MNRQEKQRYMTTRSRLSDGRFAPNEAQLNGGISEEDFDTAYAEAAANATTVNNGSGMAEATPQPTDKTTKGADAWAFD